MDFISEYKSKLGTPEDAAKLVKSGDWVEYGNGTTFAVECDKALAKRRDELFDVKLRGQIVYGPIEVVECDPTGEHFCYNAWHCSGYERKLLDQGRAYFSPMIFRNLAWYHKEFLHVNVAYVCATPMDKHGYFNFSLSAGTALDMIAVSYTHLDVYKRQGQDQANSVSGLLKQEVRRFLVEVAGLHPSEEGRAAHGAHDYAVLYLHIADFPGGKQGIILLVHAIHPFLNIFLELQ